MASYLITYDLRKNRDYTSLYSAIKSYGTWAKITESSWIVVTEQNAVQVRDFLSNSLDEDDRLFVMKYGGAAAWKNAIAQNDWFHKYLN